MKSTCHSGIHVAVIMDGNGRWAQRRGLQRSAGHRRGSRAVRRVVESAPRLGIGTLTLYALSSDNLSRPPREVAALMRLLERYLIRETRRCVENGVRVNAIGRRDRLPPGLLKALAATESATADGRRLHLRLAVDYSSRHLIAEAARLCAQGGTDSFAFRLGQAMNSEAPAPDVDLLIRTGGEIRLSDFLLWECAYAEFFFTDLLWPDFGAEDLGEAVREFNRRTRRFGRVLEATG